MPSRQRIALHGLDLSERLTQQAAHTDHVYLVIDASVSPPVVAPTELPPSLMTPMAVP